MIQKYMEMKYGPKKPVEEVTTEEYVAAAVAAGVSEEKATFDASISIKFGSLTEVAGRLLKIVEK